MIVRTDLMKPLATQTTTFPAPLRAASWVISRAMKTAAIPSLLYATASQIAETVSMSVIAVLVGGFTRFCNWVFLKEVRSDNLKPIYL